MVWLPSSGAVQVVTSISPRVSTASPSRSPAARHTSRTARLTVCHSS